MKHMLKWALAMCMLCLFLLLPATQAKAATNEGVDLVVLMSHRKLMGTTDPAGSRYDATQLLLSMLDTKHSTAGVVLFGQDVVSGHSALNHLWRMDDAKNRQFLLDTFTNNRERLTQQDALLSGTDFGDALQQALEMLESGTNKTQVIVLLTNSETQIYNLQGQTNENETNQAILLAKKMINEAVARDVKIVTVALSSPRGGYSTELLSTMTQSTFAGNGCIPVAAPEDLAGVFTDIFFEYLHSDLEMKTVTSFQKDDRRSGSFEAAEVYVPNASTQEVNIIVQRREGATADSFHLYDPDNNRIKADSKTVFCTEAGSYLVYKLVQPAKAGSYRVSFPAGKTEQVQSFIQYDLAPAMSLSAAKAAKNAPIDIQAWLTEDGSRRKDASLYESITATLKVYNVSRQLLAEIDIPATASGYALTSDMKAWLGEDYGQGSFELQVVFEGENLRCTAPVQKLTLTNAIPKAAAASTIRFVFNDPDTGIDTPEQVINLQKYVTDDNGDPLTFVVEHLPEGLKARMVSEHELGISQTRQTVSADVKIKASDGDGGSVSLTLPVSVTDLSGTYADYGLHMELMEHRGEKEPVHLAKNEQVQVVVTPLHSGEAVAHELHGLIVTLQTSHGETATIAMTRQPDGTYTGLLPATNKTSVYSLHADARFGSLHAGTPKSTEFSAVVDNNIPVTAGTLEAVEFSYNDPKGNPDTDLITIELSGRASDGDGDPLTFTVDSAPEGVTARIDGSVLYLSQNRCEVTGDVVIRVSDGDGGEALLHQPVKVIDLSNIYAAYGLRLEIAHHDQSAETIALSKLERVIVRITPIRDDLAVDEPIYSLEAYYTVNGGEQIRIPMVRQPDGFYEGEFTADTRIVDYVIGARAKFGSDSGTPKDTSRTARVENTPPRPLINWQAPLTQIRHQAQTFLATIFGGPKETAYWIDSFIFDKETGAVTINAAEGFQDFDGAAEKLQYTATLSGGGSSRQLTVKDGIFVLDKSVLNVTGSYKLVITCTDNDGSKAEQTLTFVVASLRERSVPNLLILAAIAIIVFFIISRAVFHAKPAYGPLMLCLQFGSIPQPVEKKFPLHGWAAKNKYKLSRFHDESIEKLHKELTAKIFSHIEFQPCHNGEGNRVKVKLTAKQFHENVKVAVDGKILNAANRTATLEVSKKLTLTIENAEPVISYELSSYEIDI